MFIEIGWQDGSLDYGLDTKPDDFGFNHWDPPGRELTPAICPLISTCVL